MTNDRFEQGEEREAEIFPALSQAMGVAMAPTGSTSILDGMAYNVNGAPLWGVELKTHYDDSLTSFVNLCPGGHGRPSENDTSIAIPCTKDGCVDGGNGLAPILFDAPKVMNAVTFTDLTGVPCKIVHYYPKPGVILVADADAYWRAWFHTPSGTRRCDLSPTQVAWRPSHGRKVGSDYDVTSTRIDSPLYAHYKVSISAGGELVCSLTRNAGVQGTARLSGETVPLEVIYGYAGVPLSVAAKISQVSSVVPELTASFRGAKDPEVRQDPMQEFRDGRRARFEGFLAPGVRHTDVLRLLPSDEGS